MKKIAFIPARGIALAVALSIPLWALIISVSFWVVR